MKSILLTALLAFAAFSPALAQVRPLAPFHAIKVGGGIELTLTGGHEQRVEVSVEPAELASELKTTVEDGVLTLRQEYSNDHSPLRQHMRLRVAVTADQLTALTAGGGAAVTAQGPYAAREFRLELTGGAAVRADLATTDLNVRQGGGSTLSLSGQATNVRLAVSGGAIFSGSNLATNTCEVQASGGSIVRLNAKDSLTATASGGSTIKYHGSPQVTKNVSNSATIKAM